MPFVKHPQPPYEEFPEIALKEIEVLSRSEARALPLDNFPGYAVTWTGEVWTVRRPNSHKYGKPKKRVLAPYNGDEGGFYTVALRDDQGVAHQHSVSKLVALTFISEQPFDDALVIHVNGDIQDNRASNLKWATWEEFGKNKAKHETMAARGVGVTLAKLTDEQAREIALRTESESDEDIAKDYHVSRSVVHNIRHGKTWKHLDLQPTRTGRFRYGGSRSHFAKLDEQKVIDIRRKTAEGWSKEQLATLYQVHIMTISQIIRRVTWRHVE